MFSRPFWDDLIYRYLYYAPHPEADREEQIAADTFDAIAVYCFEQTGSWPAAAVGQAAAVAARADELIQRLASRSRFGGTDRGWKILDEVLDADRAVLGI